MGDNGSHFREVFEAVGDLVLIVAPTGRVLFANQAWREALGYSQSETADLSVFEVIHWRDRAVCQAWLQGMNATAELVSLRLAFIAKNGREVPVEGTAMPCIEEGRVVCARVFLRDVTEQRRADAARRESEERFRLLSAHAPVGVFQTDRSGRLTYTNARWRWMAGFTAVTEPRGVWWQTVYPDDRDRVVEQWQSALRHGHEFLSEFRIHAGLRTVRWARTRVAQVCDPDGAVASCIGITEDITDLKRHERDLSAARDAALEASRVKNQFLANVSHEIRTPMNGVLGLLDLLLDTSIAGDPRRFAEMARDNAVQLLALLNDILDLSRIEAGKLVLDRAPFLLRGAIDACVTPAAAQAAHRNVEVTMTVDSTVPDQVCGDAVRLRQVLCNLLGNAVKYTDQGNVTVHVARIGGSPGSVELYFTIRDTGIGIPKDALDRLFQPFTRVEHPDAEHYEGTGLGLAISRELVEMMGGEIGVESQVGVGSCFWFTILLDLPSEALSSSRTAPDDPGIEVSHPLPSGLRVLLVEDNAVNLRVATWQLGRLGCHVTVATQGKEALQTLETAWFDLVLLDCQMPGMDGLEVARRLRELEGSRRADDPSLRPLYVAALTAQAMAGDRERCLAAGMDDYVSKPARTPDFEALLRRCCEQRRSPAAPRSVAAPAG
ncbi:MAG TPA: ATP-binding protein [Verrucomicrobiota bacterium]|nr:ATP-binding protein [Verrucomicrobiota bacterium]HNU49346.1 ATP-binding protein [Verrucomicrobiota bacterium]